MFSPIRTMFNYFPLRAWSTVLILFLISWYTYRKTREKWETDRLTKTQSYAQWLLVSYILLLLFLTVLGRRSMDYYRYNFDIGYSYRSVYYNGNLQMLPTIAVNIAMFVPVGFLGAIGFKRFGILKALLLGVLLTASIEFLQLMLRNGTCEIDDLISNLIGTVFGSVLGLVFCPLISCIKMPVFKFYTHLKQSHAGKLSLMTRDGCLFRSNKLTNDIFCTSNGVVRMETSVYTNLIRKQSSLALIGLGYVGMPIAVAFANKGLNVIGFDLNKEKIDLYKSGIDPTNEVGSEVLGKTTMVFTADEQMLKRASFYIVAVPTPINTDHTPDLTPVISASEIVGRNLSRGSIVVYESTVYPGVTEDVCIPILEKISGLKAGTDFKVGYSPERINPGDKVHRLENIRKIVSGMDAASLEEIKNVYDLVIEAGTYPVSSIKTAEAVKVVENSQRDINIAFMNELAIVFDRMGIDTNEVVDGMNTKWNALGFRPGLVGGHCIGVDPYYFTYEAEKLGYHSQIILNGRIVNDGMGRFVADAAIKQMINAGQAPKKANVVILGLTFKENCPDTRNSKVDDIIKRLNEYGIQPAVVDPWANRRDAMHEYGVTLTALEDIHDADCIIVAVAHNEFRKLSLDAIKAMFRQDTEDAAKVLIDVKGLYPIENLKASGMSYWRL